MKGKRFLLLGLVLGGVIGWALGYLRFPYLEKSGSFLVGLGGLIWTLMYEWHGSVLGCWISQLVKKKKVLARYCTCMCARQRQQRLGGHGEIVGGAVRVKHNTSLMVTA